MNKHNTKTVSLLSEAIVAVMADEQGKATQLVAQALRNLTASAAPSPVVVTARKPRKKGSGRRPALNPAQVANLNARVAAGDGVPIIAKNFGVSYPTAYRYYQRALEAATAPSN